MKKIWFNKSAEDFNEAFHLGNGRLGATVYGNSGHEIVSLNEESVWTKKYSVRNNKSARNSIKKIRELINLNRMDEAQELTYESFMGLPESCGSYKPAGKVHFDFYTGESYGLTTKNGERKNPFQCSFYNRELDLETGIASVEFAQESKHSSNSDLSSSGIGSSITYKRECFVSLSEDVIIYHASASSPKNLFARIGIENDEAQKIYALTDDTIVAEVNANIPFAIMVTAVASGGKVYTCGASLIVENADEVTFYIDIETNHRPYYCADLALKKICLAGGLPYNTVKERHAGDFSELYENSSLVLGTGESKLSVPEIKENKESADFINLFTSYARYLLISSTAKAKYPALANGIWKEDSAPEHYELLNNNSILCASSMGLKQMDALWFSLLKKLSKNGNKTAYSMYGSGGSVSHNATDIYGDSAPCGKDLTAGSQPLGQLELACAVVDYYEYTLNLKFLKKSFKYIRRCAEFFGDYLVSADDGKYKVLFPAMGAEGILAEGTEEQNKKVYHLFSRLLDAASYLGYEPNDPLVVNFSSLRDKLKVADIQSESDNEYAVPDFMNETFAALNNTYRAVAKSSIEKGKVVVNLFNTDNSLFKTGKLQGMSLKGNLYMDLEWQEGHVLAGKIYGKEAERFYKEVVVVLNGKSYSAPLTDGTLDIMNVLPTVL